MVSSCMLVGGFGFLNSWRAHPTGLWTDKGLGLGWLRCSILFLPPVSFLCGCMPLCLKLRLAFLTDERQAAMTDGWFLPAQAISSAGLCNAFLEHHDCAFLLEARWKRLLWACVRLPSLWRGVRLPSLWRGQPSTAAPEARWILCWAGWISWGLLHSTHGLAIWC